MSCHCFVDLASTYSSYASCASTVHLIINWSTITIVYLLDIKNCDPFHPHRPPPTQIRISLRRYCFSSSSTSPLCTHLLVFSPRVFLRCTQYSLYSRHPFPTITTPARAFQFINHIFSKTEKDRQDIYLNHWP